MAKYYQAKESDELIVLLPMPGDINSHFQTKLLERDNDVQKKSEDKIQDLKGVYWVVFFTSEM